MENDESPLIHGTLAVFLVVMGSASFLVTIFHLIILCRTHRNLTNQNTQQEQPIRSLHRTGENSVVPHLIPAHKYEKKKKKKKQSDDGDGNGNDEDDDDTCAVCLGDFEDGEDVRTLPECMHSFHVACIDAWLHSHSNCPVCRANAATPSPSLQLRLPESAQMNASRPHHTVDIVEIAMLSQRIIT